jgi:hypothetical protein
MRCDANDMFPAPCSRCQKAGKSCVIDPDFHRTAMRELVPLPFAGILTVGVLNLLGLCSRLKTLEKEFQDIRHAFGSSQTLKITPTNEGNVIQSDASPSDHFPDENVNEDLPSKEEMRLMLSTSQFFLDTPVLGGIRINIDNACYILLE